MPTTSSTGALLAVNPATTQTRSGSRHGSLPVPTSVSRGSPRIWTSQLHDVDMIINTATALHDLVPEMRVGDESAVHLHGVCSWASAYCRGVIVVCKPG